MEKKLSKPVEIVLKATLISFVIAVCSTVAYSFNATPAICTMTALFAIMMCVLIIKAPPYINNEDNGFKALNTSFDSRYSDLPWNIYYSDHHLFRDDD